MNQGSQSVLFSSSNEVYVYDVFLSKSIANDDFISLIVMEEMSCFFSVSSIIFFFFLSSVVTFASS